MSFQSLRMLCLKPRTGAIALRFSLFTLVLLGFSGLSAWATPPAPEFQPDTAMGYVAQAPLPTAAATTTTTPTPAQWQGTLALDIQQALSQFMLAYNRNLSWEQANLMSNAIIEFSRQHDVDFRLVLAVIAVESSFRYDAISSSGAIGLGQLKPDTARWLGVSNPFDPVDNIAGMSRYLSYLLRQFPGSLDKAVGSYYQGQGSVARDGLKDDSLRYLHKVNHVLRQFRLYRNTLANSNSGGSFRQP